MSKVKNSKKSKVNVSESISEVVSEVVSEEPAQKQKRGRKTKKEIEEIKKQKINDDINIVINEINTGDLNTGDLNEIISNNNLVHNSDSENDEPNTILINKDSNLIKKRGRKPKGGKIIQQIIPINSNIESKPNIILHLNDFLIYYS